jgi:hypothetical protein
VDALKKVGKTLGHVSSALDWGVALYEGRFARTAAWGGLAAV